MFVVNPVVCPICIVRCPKDTKTCSVCGTEIPYARRLLYSVLRYST